MMGLNRLKDALASAGIGPRPCHPKEQHFSKGVAEAQLRSITRRELEKDLGRIHVYVCPDCSRRYQRRVWHVGHYAR